MTPDLDAVFAVTASGTRYRLTDPLPWAAAVDQFNAYNDPRYLNGRVTLVGRELVKHFAVRSVNDHDWSDAARATDVRTIDLDWHHFCMKSGGPLKAVRDYAAGAGITGRTGGWLYNEQGQPVTHGWASWLMRTVPRLRRDHASVSAALAHHFGAGA